MVKLTIKLGRGQTGGVHRYRSTTGRWWRQAAHCLRQSLRNDLPGKSAKEPVKGSVVRNPVQFQGSPKFSMLGQTHLSLTVSPILEAHQAKDSQKLGLGEQVLRELAPVVWYRGFGYLHSYLSKSHQPHFSHFLLPTPTQGQSQTIFRRRQQSPIASRESEEMKAMEEQLHDVQQLGMDLVKRIGEADLPGLSAEMSYRFLFALFPFVLFIVALAGFFGNEEMALSVVERMRETMPEQAAAILAGPVQQVLTTQRADLLSIGAITALWGASGVMGTIMKGMNRTHQVTDNRKFLVKNVVQVSLTLFLAVLLLVAVAAVFVTQMTVASFGLGRFQATLASIAGPLLALLILILGVSIIYWRAPALEYHPFKLITLGAVAFAVGWVVATFLFSWYVAQFGQYNAMYGSIGVVIILLLWAYLSSFLLLLGETLNAVLEERRQARVPLQRDAQG
jgi:membrane protein